MVRRTPLLVAALLVCALAVAGLAACSSDSGQSSQGNAPAPAEEESANNTPAPTDEELIKADIEKTIGTYIGKEELAEGLKSDESVKELMQYGFDVDAFAESVANNFKIEVTSVEVDGDAAVATIDITMPSFGGDAADQMLDDALAKKTEGMDITQIPEEDAMKLVVEAAMEVMSDPNFPTETESLDLDYVMKDGQWSLKDTEETRANLSEKALAAAGV